MGRAIPPKIEFMSSNEMLRKQAELTAMWGDVYEKNAERVERYRKWYRRQKRRLDQHLNVEPPEPDANEDVGKIEETIKGMKSQCNSEEDELLKVLTEEATKVRKEARESEQVVLDLIVENELIAEIHRTVEEYESSMTVDWGITVEEDDDIYGEQYPTAER